MKSGDRLEERTGFQEGKSYNPNIDLQTDFVMVYGLDNNLKARIKKWREKGYVVHLMTGVSWGQYQNYLNGKYDGRSHWDEAQKDRRYENIIHGTSEDIPYMVPTHSYTGFLIDRIRLAIDAGVEAIHLEEPEFWVEGGYSKAFKREWEIYYQELWQEPHESVDAQYRASRLKAYLYTRTLDYLCSNLKEYAKIKYDRNLRFYVPTHSLINYTQWRIISPESRLMDLPAVDGYIAQIWTGTSRTPNVYQGVRKERTFETAYLEYGIMQELVRGTGRRMWFLHDPVEDDPDHSWDEYKNNYFKTVTASLLHPDVARYEVCPWPNRVFNGQYPTTDGSGKEGIPSEYATNLLVLMNTLRDMKQDDIAWKNDKVEIGLLLADSAIYQRNYPDWSEEDTSFKYDGTVVESALGNEFKEILDWSPFYGLALPLLKHGLPVRPVQLDNIRRFPGYLEDYKVLVLSYEYMKPEYPDIHNALSQWVRDGGVLIYVGDGTDPYHGVREWWNQHKKVYNNPAEHLFESLGLKKELSDGYYSVGNGLFAFLSINPVECAHKREGAEKLREIVFSAVNKSDNFNVKLSSDSSLVLRRGPYVVAAVMNESVNKDPLVLKGNYVNLFDPELPVIHKVKLKSDEQILLFDLSHLESSVELIAAASRIENLQKKPDGFSFFAYGPQNVSGVARFGCDRKPEQVCLINSNNGEKTECLFDWDENSSTVLLYYNNDPSGSEISVINS